jgi:hypothetical protein
MNNNHHHLLHHQRINFNIPRAKKHNKIAKRNEREREGKLYCFKSMNRTIT